jgi:hypothetical protein
MQGLVSCRVAVSNNPNPLKEAIWLRLAGALLYRAFQIAPDGRIRSGVDLLNCPNDEASRRSRWTRLLRRSPKGLGTKFGRS